MSLLDRLTNGALGHILDGKSIQELIFQILACKNESNNDIKRCRLLLNDGAYKYQCYAIVDELVEKFKTEEYDIYCLLEVKKYTLTETQNKKIIVLEDIKLIAKGNEVGERLGNPEKYGSPEASPLSRFNPINTLY